MYHLKYKSTISRAIYAIKQIIIPTKQPQCSKSKEQYCIKNTTFRERKPKNVQDKIDNNFPVTLTLVTYVGANGVHVA